MKNTVNEKVTKILNEVSTLKQVNAIGRTGDISIEPKPGESDIDIFVIGEEIPGYEVRKAVYDRCGSLFSNCIMNVCEGGDWGTGDILNVDGVETMFMYFRTDETIRYMNEVLEGRHLDKVNGFYPMGHCATLKNIHILYDEINTLGVIKEKLHTYPEELLKKMVRFHIDRVYHYENFSRVALRKDVLFYHVVIENCIDSYLQALFALNKTFFPSRKRTKQYLDSFSVKPERCYERLLEVIQLGSESERINKSIGEWLKLVNDLKHLCARI